jgi:hypothetical protein
MTLSRTAARPARTSWHLLVAHALLHAVIRSYLLFLQCFSHVLAYFFSPLILFFLLFFFLSRHQNVRPLRSPGPETEMNPPPLKGMSQKFPYDQTRPL